MSYELILGDCVEVMRGLQANSVQCCVTSPPYYGLRDYGTATWEGGDAACDHVERTAADVSKSNGLGKIPGYRDHLPEDNAAFKSVARQFRATCGKCGARRIDQQIGLEETPELYCAKLVEVFREVRRVLHPSGVVFLNLGDSYYNYRPGGVSQTKQSIAKHNGSIVQTTSKRNAIFEGIKEKDLIGVPWMVAFALRADGWWLRSEIIWHKKAPMPESVTDRPTKAHEQVFLLSKAATYYYDAEAIREPMSEATKERDKHGFGGAFKGQFRGTPGEERYQDGRAIESPKFYNEAGRNKRSVWTLGPEPYHAAHFAVMPSKLVEPCILAGTSAKGCCAACGAPWERVVGRVGERETHGINKVADDARAHEPMRANGTRHGNTSVMSTGIVAVKETTGWQPTCTCNREGIQYAPDDLELIDTPTGERVADDPTMRTGRAGMNRPRGDNEGSRPITRYEQRRYAEQLRNSPHRERMERDAGSAFAHYIRTDSSGARPLPQELLEAWIRTGWLERVNVPTFTPLDVVPCTVLDPFAGSGTTLAVALKHHRHGIGIELNESYISLAHDRIRKSQPMLLTV